MQYMAEYDRTEIERDQNGKQDVGHEAIQTLTLRCLQGLQES